MTNKTKFKVVKITFLSTDGWTDDPIDLPVEFIGEDAWRQANTYLRYWALTMPTIAGRSSNQIVDFDLEFENQNSYPRGMYLLHGNDLPCLATHIIKYQSNALSVKKSLIYTDQQWEEMQNSIKDLLDNYELKQNVGYCPETLQRLLDIAYNSPMLFDYGTEKNPMEFRLQGVSIWLKIAYKNMQGTPSEVHAQNNKIYYFTDSIGGTYYKYPQDAASDLEVVRFAKVFFTKADIL
ncbi:hypothetical protein FD723_39730 (plasmid) [Nostoc sp. C052]|uniref:hypothetical protein n=1 Tax=Nostoc sp. C052 TaxID=2576902 RepID=UPI0015C3D99C|nr:hypothetical protein [Nostoc sp. C052]QLE46343.1 hypothetical protein FD723_39730 [Nostoc sp. C052]